MEGNLVENVFCRECGAEISEKAEICPKCGVRQKQNNLKNPFFALLCSAFFTGFGQFYNGEFWKGIIFILAQILNILLIAVAIGLITLPLTWIYGMYDAYTTAEKINSGN